MSLEIKKLFYNNSGELKQSQVEFFNQFVDASFGSLRKIREKSKLTQIFVNTTTILHQDGIHPTPISGATPAKSRKDTYLVMNPSKLTFEENQSEVKNIWKEHCLNLSQEDPNKMGLKEGEVKAIIQIRLSIQNEDKKRKLAWVEYETTMGTYTPQNRIQSASTKSTASSASSFIKKEPLEKKEHANDELVESLLRDPDPNKSSFQHKSAKDIDSMIKEQWNRAVQETAIRTSPKSFLTRR